MWVLQTIVVALSMYTAVPMPRIEWTERNMRYALCAFPTAGLLTGAGCALWNVFVARYGFPDLLRGAGLCVIPVLVTGGIHLDGYADTCDALASHAAPERRREILKDSHCGAFAVIRLCTYFTLQLALCAAFQPTARALACLTASHCLSRALSGLALLILPLSNTSGLAYLFASSAAKRRARLLLSVETLCAAVALWVLGGLAGFVMTLAAGAAFALYAHTARTAFGGTSGDLAGWFLQRAEQWMLAALVLCQYMR